MKLFNRKITVPDDLRLVSSHDPDEVDPGPLGMTRAGVEAIWDTVLDLYRAGHHPAVALCIRRRGEVVLDRAIGHERGNGPGESSYAEKILATPRSPFCIFSASKAITAVLVHILDERGRLHIDDPVAEYLPAFARRNKGNVTIRHIMTHRAGIPSLALGGDVRLLLRWDEIIERLCDAKPLSPPGRKLAYHAVTGGFILGEIVRRVTGLTVRELLTQEIREPLGLRHFSFGVDAADVPLVVRNYLTGFPPGFPFSALFRRSLGVEFEQAVEVSNDPLFLTGIVPSANLVCTANELSRFFQLLLDGGIAGTQRIFSRRLVYRAINESSWREFDASIGLPIRYGVGLMLGSPLVSPFGPDTPNAYGHLGFVNISGWVDPDREISVAFLNSGKPFIGRHIRHLLRFLGAVSRHCPKGERRE
ncbi:MAG: beta-lactamase family protein [Myxococcales bacterium]|nr:beta-lactamase family protein [Myxococcales bacterium]